jgi:hypothetical protein
MPHESTIGFFAEYSVEFVDFVVSKDFGGQLIFAPEL